jgi:predicted AAA+ superfamily ATPase
VCLTALESETLKREMEPLKRIKDNFPKYLLTLDEAFANENIEGIIKTNALDWLMGV